MRGPYRKRCVHSPPRINQFKPSGVRKSALQSVNLNLDEFEAIRLADFEGLDHNESAQKMGVSRPTFSRLIEKARNKVAQAIINGWMLTIEGGNIHFTHQRCYCENCNAEIEKPVDEDVLVCPDCGSESVQCFHGRHRHSCRNKSK